MRASGQQDRRDLQDRRDEGQGQRFAFLKVVNSVVRLLGGPNDAHFSPQFEAIYLICKNIKSMIELFILFNRRLI